MQQPPQNPQRPSQQSHPSYPRPQYPPQPYQQPSSQTHYQPQNYPPQPSVQPVPMPPYQPPKAPAQRNLWQKFRGLSLGMKIVVIIVALFICSAAINGIQHSGGNTSSTTQAVDPLAGPTLGGTQDAFEAKYGKASNEIGGLFFYQNLQVSIVPDTKRVDNMLAGIPKGHPWTLDQGKQECKSFFPKDAVYVKTYKTLDADKQQDGMMDIYTSKALAGVFDAGKFTGQQHKNMAPGTFSVKYTYWFDPSKNATDTTHYLQCELNLGIPDVFKLAS